MSEHENQCNYDDDQDVNRKRSLDDVEQEQTVVSENIQFKKYNIRDPTVVDTIPFRLRRSSVIVELTDAKITEVEIASVLQAGCNILKFKTGISTSTDKYNFLAKVQEAKVLCCQKLGSEDFPVATCLSLKTCMMKTGILHNDQEFVNIAEGTEVVLTYNHKYIYKSNERKIFVDNPQLTVEMKVGMEVNISQAEIILEVVYVHEAKRSVKCKCLKAGKLRNMQSVCVRNLRHTRPFMMTKKDLQILKFVVDNQIDIIIINYARNADTIRSAKKFLNGYTDDKSKIPIIFAGICTINGLKDVDALLKQSDGLLIARDYLPYELPKDMQFRLPMIQKYLAGKCLKAGKPFYVSGGVFYQTLETGEPIDGEVVDITSGLMDGATGFVLKDCLKFENSMAVIQRLSRVCCYVEPMTGGRNTFWELAEEKKMPLNAAEAAVLSAMVAANQTQARVLILPTVSGHTVKALLRMRPICMILAVSTNVRITKLLITMRGVLPIYFTGNTKFQKFARVIQERIEFAVKYAVARSLLSQGDMYIVLHRSTDSSCYCDMVRIWSVFIKKKDLIECPSKYSFEKIKEDHENIDIGNEAKDKKNIGTENDVVVPKLL